MKSTPQKALKELLVNLNLSDVEIEVYIATLESGNGTASAISKIVGKQRVTTYEVLKRLIKLGFVKVRVKAGSKVKYFEPVTIQEIKNKLASKKTNLTCHLRQSMRIKISLQVFLKKPQ
jgi:sugar-specific transcriptional regulator TrmB